jgi:TonB family protein
MLRARALWILAVGAAIVILFAARARADNPRGGSAAIPTATSTDSSQPPPPPPPSVKLPVVKHDEGAEYPKQALQDGVRADVKVALTLEIDATGIVKNVTVKTPVGHGFDEAAVEAASKLVFEPATRDGKPFAIKISYDYAFTPPAGALAGGVNA